MEGIWAFIGFVAGVIVTRLTEYLFRRQERRETRQEESERRLRAEMREMLEEAADDAARLRGALFGVWMDTAIGMPGQQAYARFNQKRLDQRDAAKRKHKWQPYRIQDSQLRTLAEELNSCTGDMERELLGVINAANAHEFMTSLVGRIQRLEELDRRIFLRLDELGW